MTFAFSLNGMLSFASRAALASGVVATGCVATNTIEFSSEENYPPSVVSQQNAEYPLREIGQLNLDESLETELPLDVIVRDPNVDETLEYRIFLDSTSPPDTDFTARIDDGTIDPQGGSVDRPTTFNIPYSLLAPGECHKIELLVAGKFSGFVDLRATVDEGDFDNVTWWIEVTDADNLIATRCR